MQDEHASTPTSHQGNDPWQIPGAFSALDPLVPENPPVGQWEAIKARMTKKRRRPILWWFFTGFALASLGLGTYAGMVSLGTILIENEVVVHEKNQTRTRGVHVPLEAETLNNSASAATLPSTHLATESSTTHPKPSKNQASNTLANTLSATEKGEENGLPNLLSISKKPKANSGITSSKERVSKVSYLTNIQRQSHKKQMDNLSDKTAVVKSERLLSSNSPLGPKRELDEAKASSAGKPVEQQPSSTNEATELSRAIWPTPLNSNSLQRTESSLSAQAEQADTIPKVVQAAKPVLEQVDSTQKPKTVEPVQESKPKSLWFVGAGGLTSMDRVTLPSAASAGGTKLNTLETAYGWHAMLGLRAPTLFGKNAKLKAEISLQLAGIQQNYRITPGSIGEVTYTYQSFGDSLVATPNSVNKTNRQLQVGLLPSVRYGFGSKGLTLLGGLGLWGVQQVDNGKRSVMLSLQPQVGLSVPVLKNIEILATVRYKSPSTSNFSSLQGRQERFFYGLGVVWQR